MLHTVRKRAAATLRTAGAYAAHYLLASERRREHSPFFRRYPYEGRMALRRVDQQSVVDLDAGFLFHRILKSANSAFTASLFQYKTGETVAPASHRAMKGARALLRTPSSLSADEVAQVTALYKFVVVRDPYARVLSAYLSKALYLDGKRRSKPSVQSARAPDWTADPSFDAFCRYLADGGLYYNAHWAPQVDYLLFPVEEYDFVGRVETLREDFDVICRRIFGGPGPYSLLTEDPNHATGAKSRMETYYTPELRRLVGELYARDFEAFGYSG